MEKLMDDRGISPLVATVILIAITVAAAGSIAVIITRLSPGGTTVFTVSVDMLYTENDTVASATTLAGGIAYSGASGYGWANENTVYFRVVGVGPSGRVYSPTVDLRISFSFTVDNLITTGVQATAVSASVTFPATLQSGSLPGTPVTPLGITAIQQTTSTEGYFEIGNVWMIKVANIPGTPCENTTVSYVVATAGKTPGAESAGSSYWTKSATPPG